jgi:serine/threonine-protein kinase
MRDDRLEASAPSIPGEADLGGSHEAATSRVHPPDRRPPPGSTTEAAGRELQPLLRRRLMVISALAIWGFVPLCIADAALFGGFAPMARDPQGLAFFVIHCAGVALYAASLALLARAPALRLNTLRALEQVGFGYAAFTFAAEALVPRPQALIDALTLPAARRLQSNVEVLPWFMLITLYGVLVPNTMRRAAVVVTGFVVAAIAVSAVNWFRQGLSSERLLTTIPLTFGWLGIAAGLVVFNTGRLDAYRRAVASARELGRYRLGRKLGGGGMGEVYLAEHRLLKRPCAIKLIRPERALDTSFITRFEREVSATTRLTHPSAIQVYDYGRADDGTFYYVMEYLPGLTLDELVRRAGPLPFGRIVHLLRQVCGALAEAHGLGLIHRDVKPGNVMLCRLGDRADVAKLLDFGLVREAGPRADSHLTADGSLLGTPAYMSPEQAKGSKDLGPASDLYSLGALAYFLATSQPPFSGRNALETLHAHLTQPVTSPSTVRPGLPPKLDAVILSLLEKEPAARPSDAAAVEAALASCATPDEWTPDAARQWWEQFERHRSTAALDAAPAPIPPPSDGTASWL